MLRKHWRRLAITLAAIGIAGIVNAHAQTQAPPVSGVTINLDALATEKTDVTPVRRTLLAVPKLKPRNPELIAIAPPPEPFPVEDTASADPAIAMDLVVAKSTAQATPKLKPGPPATMGILEALVANAPPAPQEPLLAPVASPVPPPEPEPQPEPPAAQPSPAPVQDFAALKPTIDANSQNRSSVLAGQSTALRLRFQAGKNDLTPEAKASLNRASASLAALGTRIQLAAYSGKAGDNSSGARRLSLRRALTVRDYLAAGGVVRTRVNVVAFGGATEGGSDRVDVMVRSDLVARIPSP
jgi:outer membrane protein OmpA-like peptidoglycan-associated protein